MNKAMPKLYESPSKKKKNLSEKPLNVSGFLLIHYQKGLNT